MLFRISCLLLGFGLCLHAAENGRSAVLIELFTSEGCSSCPPADILVQQLEARQPIPEAQLLVLSEHVDYWNHDGWKDPYSSTKWTDRQSAYARVLGLDDIYTPQLLVNGFMALPRGNEQELLEALRKAAAEVSVPVQVRPIPNDQNGLRAHIEADGRNLQHSADIYLAIALKHAESQVSAGENHGRHLTHVEVLQALKKVGTLEPGKTVSQDIKIDRPVAGGSNNVSVIAFVQERGPGKILGASRLVP